MSNRAPVVEQFSLKRFFLRLAINIIAILIAVSIVPGLELTGPWWALAVVALIFGLINTAIRPMLLLLALPFVVLTLGFFMLLINAAMLYLTSLFAEIFNIGLHIDSFLSAVLGALVISIISSVLNVLSGESRVQFQVVRGPQDK